MSSSGRPLNVLERAFEIAESGRLSSIKPLRRMLLEEGYAFSDVSSNLNGLAIRRALKLKIEASQAPVRG